MRMRRTDLAILLASALLPVVGQAEVRVAFVEPERYTDAALQQGYRSSADGPALRELRQCLVRLGERYLRPGDVLSVDILDVDLAGWFEPWRAEAYHVRFLSEGTWPRLHLRYNLASARQTKRSAEVELVDQSYLQRSAAGASGDRLFYEKRMLEDWFRAQFENR